MYDRYDSSVLLVVSLLPPTVTVLAADPAAIHLVNTGGGGKHQFHKAGQFVIQSIARFGPSILNVQDGPDWRRHRKVTAVSFTEANTAQAWGCAANVTRQWMEQLETKEIDQHLAEKLAKPARLVRNVERDMALVTILARA